MLLVVLLRAEAVPASNRIEVIFILCNSAYILQEVAKMLVLKYEVLAL